MSKFKVLLYATKAKPYLFNETRSPYPNYQLEDDKYLDDVFELLNGKVCAMFEWGGYEKIVNEPIDKIMDEDGVFYYTKNIDSVLLLKKSCLTYQELDDYLYAKKGYAWHIDNFQMLDEPIELGELYNYNKLKRVMHPSDKDLETTLLRLQAFNGNLKGYFLTIAPQSYMWVYYKGEKCLLLSIKSEWLYKILNGEKTVEIRKSVPKELR